MRTTHREDDDIEETERGLIVDVIDCGTIIRVVIDTEAREMVAAVADGNLFRRAITHYRDTHPDVGSLLGMPIEFQRTTWGGLLRFRFRSDWR